MYSKGYGIGCYILIILPLLLIPPWPISKKLTSWDRKLGNIHQGLKLLCKCDGTVTKAKSSWVCGCRSQGESEFNMRPLFWCSFWRPTNRASDLYATAQSNINNPMAINIYIYIHGYVYLVGWSPLTCQINLEPDPCRLGKMMGSDA